MSLQRHNAIIYGAGSVAGANIARALANDGATVFLAGRSKERLEPLAEEILSRGGSAEVAVLDPLDPRAVEDHASYVANEFGSFDLSINLAFRTIELDPRLTGLSESEFSTAAFTRVRSNFITAITAARKMAYQGSGTILGIAADGPRLPRLEYRAPSVAGAAIEALFQHLAGEVAAFGVRVVCLRTGPNPDGFRWEEAARALAEPGAGTLSETGHRGWEGSDLGIPSPTYALARRTAGVSSS